jgi:NaMN:DMB phosphoribosyltransferase
VGKGGEMTQMYAHMNKIKIKKKRNLLQAELHQAEQNSVSPVHQQAPACAISTFSLYSLATALTLNFTLTCCFSPKVIFYTFSIPLIYILMLTGVHDTVSFFIIGTKVLLQKFS